MQRKKENDLTVNIGFDFIMSIVWDFLFVVDNNSMSNTLVTNSKISISGNYS